MRTLKKNIGSFLAFDTAWFVKHQLGLLWLLQWRLFRWALRINTEHSVVSILPSSYTICLGENKHETCFHTHTKYAKRLYFVFRPFWWALHFWDWLIADRFAPRLGFGFATLTTWPATGSGGSSCDARMTVSVTTTTFALVRNATDATSVDVSASNALVGYRSSSTTDQYLEMTRIICTFNTSLLGAAAEITSSSFSLYGASASRTFLGDDFIKVVAATPASSNDIVVADWSQFGGTSLSDTSIAATAFSSAAYNVFDLNASGLANISKTGVSQFGVRLARDLDNTAPTWVTATVTDITTWLADLGGTANDPRLIVTYTGASPLLPRNRMRPRVFAPGLAR